MKYQSSNTKTIYEIEFEPGIKKLYTCPECSNSRRKSKKKDLEFYPSSGRAYCFHCNTTFFEFKYFKKQPEYIVPTWKNITNLNDKTVKWFTGRMISQETLKKMKIYSDTEWMPQFEKSVEVICFPYFHNKELFNIKFRGPNKSFKLTSGARLSWYNFDAILNAIQGSKELIVCEGEIDALTWIENKFDNVISVPNGAKGQLEFMEDSISLFDDIEKIYLSTDNDSDGIGLRDELIRRFGPEKCYTINFLQYKDANEYLNAFGGLQFKKLLSEAKKVPISGILEIGDIEDEILDLYENGLQPGLKIDSSLDEFITWETSRLAIGTGIPQAGKSEVIDFICSKLNLHHNWKGAYFTPENFPLKYHYAKLHEKFSGQKFAKKINSVSFYNIFNHIKDNFFYIQLEENSTIDFILEKAKYLIKTKGIKYLVIDPYNKLEHQFDKGMNETQYVSIFLNKLVSFAKYHDILIILMAHPTKMKYGTIPNLYDISGSANFFNMCDYGFAVHRPIDANTGSMSNSVQIHFYKIKFKHLGKQGVLEMNYNYNNGRYEDSYKTIHEWDNSNWLDKNKQLTFDDTFEQDFSQIDEMPF